MEHAFSHIRGCCYPPHQINVAAVDVVVVVAVVLCAACSVHVFCSNQSYTDLKAVRKALG